MVLSAGESRFFDGVLFLLHLRKQPDLCEMECHSNVTKFQGQFLQFCFDACLNGCFFFRWGGIHISWWRRRLEGSINNID